MTVIQFVNHRIQLERDDLVPYHFATEKILCYPKKVSVKIPEVGLPVRLTIPWLKGMINQIRILVDM